jgi:hypothetical protein
MSNLYLVYTIGNIFTRDWLFKWSIISFNNRWKGCIIFFSVYDIFFCSQFLILSTLIYFLHLCNPVQSLIELRTVCNIPFNFQFIIFNRSLFDFHITNISIFQFPLRYCVNLWTIIHVFLRHIIIRFTNLLHFHCERIFAVRYIIKRYLNLIIFLWLKNFSVLCYLFNDWIFKWQIITKS